MSIRILSAIIAAVLFAKNNGICQYQFENDLYTCVSEKINLRGYDMEKGIKSFKSQLLKLEYIQEINSSSLYSMIMRQANCETPLVIEEYVSDIDLRVNHFATVLQICFNLEHPDREASKYYKVNLDLQSLEDQSPASVISEIHKTISKEDYDHPFFEMLLLTTLHSWSIEGFDKYGKSEECWSN